MTKGHIDAWIQRSQMPNLETFDVHAALRPDGRAQRVNVLTHKTFKTLNDHFDQHDKWRWLIVNYSGNKEVRIIDLWETTMVDEFPYVEPWFLQPRFGTADQAIGYIALNLC